MGDDDSLRTTTADKVLGADIGGTNACFARLAPVVGLLFCMPKYGAGTMLFGEVTIPQSASNVQTEAAS